jgi:AcrR family transcriptional regulator
LLAFVLDVMVTNSKIKKHGSETGSLKDRQREERTALILQVAYDVLVEKSYYEASMDEIAARAGISKGALYLHFKSKEDLIFVLIEQEIIRFLSLIDEIIHEESSVQDRLELILLETYKGIQSGRQFLVALRSIGVKARDHLEELTSMAGLRDRLTALFEEGKRRGEFDSTMPTTVMVSVFLGLMELYTNEQAVINQLSPVDLSKSVSHIFFNGLLSKH